MSVLIAGAGPAGSDPACLLARHYIQHSVQHSGRVDVQRLRRVPPLVVQGYEQHAKGAG